MKGATLMTTQTVATTVDARFLSCPMPIVKTVQQLKPLAPGTVVEVLATDPGSVKDFAAWTRMKGHLLLEQTSQDGVYRFVIQRA
jgi:tRNA 2-thiouridine synthesizing protein A